MLPPDALLELTGLRSAHFEELLVKFDARWQARVANRTVSGARRQRKPSGGYPPTLEDTRAKFLFILFYARFQPTQDALALIFGLSQGQVSHWIGRLLPVAAVALTGCRVEPARRRAKLEHLIVKCPAVLLLIRARSHRETMPAIPMSCTCSS